MYKQEFYKKVQENYFSDETIGIEDFVMTIDNTLPIFNDLDVRINKVDNGYEIIFIDKGYASVILAPKKDKLIKEQLIISTTVLSLTTDDNGVIQTINNGMLLFTTANKDVVLFLGSLIGKKIEF